VSSLQEVLRGVIDAVAREDHFTDHIIPIWLALPAEQRGTFYALHPRPGIPNMAGGIPPRGNTPTLAASAGDMKRSRRSGRPVALMEHGCGQSFGGDPKSSIFSSYAGGRDRDAQMFLHPGQHPAARDRAAYPKSRIEVVGCAKLDSLPTRVPDGRTTVCVSFHWNCAVAQETRPAYDAFQDHVWRLARAPGITVIGHGHPRVISKLNAWYRRIGIETVRNFEDVCRRADVYVNDASSTLFEFASTGRPVVVLNAPRYRRNVDHGLRFWEASGVGVNVSVSDDLEGAVRLALTDPPEQQQAREAALDLVYAYRTGGAARAAEALVDWAA
jgi:hypothetical protein